VADPVPLDKVPISPQGQNASASPAIATSTPLTTSRRETVRTALALGLLGLLVVLTLGSAWALTFHHVNDMDFKDLTSTLLTPILGVFGTVTGFYYGSHASDKSDP
jgi:hypothetical protein